AIRAACEDAGLACNAEDLEGTVALLGRTAKLGAAVPTLQAKIDELGPLADQGRKYRADLLADALAEGVRAPGAAFPKERYEALLKDAPLDHIKAFRDEWQAEGDKRLPSGRATDDSEEKAPAPAPAAQDRRIPAAHKA